MIKSWQRNFASGGNSKPRFHWGHKKYDKLNGESSPNELGYLNDDTLIKFFMSVLGSFFEA